MGSACLWRTAPVVRRVNPGRSWGSRMVSSAAPSGRTMTPLMVSPLLSPEAANLPTSRARLWGLHWKVEMSRCSERRGGGTADTPFVGVSGKRVILWACDADRLVMHIPYLVRLTQAEAFQSFLHLPPMASVTPLVTTATCAAISIHVCLTHWECAPVGYDHGLLICWRIDGPAHFQRLCVAL